MIMIDIISEYIKNFVLSAKRHGRLLGAVHSRLPPSLKELRCMIVVMPVSAV